MLVIFFAQQPAHANRVEQVCTTRRVSPERLSEKCVANESFSCSFSSSVCLGNFEDENENDDEEGKCGLFGQPLGKQRARHQSRRSAAVIPTMARSIRGRTVPGWWH